MNRLGSELSPYLLEHAENPVDWYPWGDDAFARAKELDRPILLSIGYSACHWCHVMARESFSSEAVAKQMNAEFVSVKVDREERPDVDQIHQLVVQRMGRAGGWPLTVFLTPDRKPFFGGTYFPDVPKHGMPSFPEVLSAVTESWKERRAQIEEGADEIVAEIAELAAPPKGRAEGEIPKDAIVLAAKRLARRFDEVHGGFGERPKFPSTMSLDVMLRAGHAGDSASLVRVRKTLDAMAAGGIHDQLGGGFHRYSTDEKWLVPHFEKMLYDDALLLRTYAEASVAMKEPAWAEVAERIVLWAEREMSAPDGTFYSSQDADSEGEEGRFFVWTEAELDAVLGDDARIAKRYFGVGAGNFEGSNRSVLSAQPIEAVARGMGIDVATARAAVERAREKLFAEREKRVRPFRDEKVLATWNGLFIGALARAGAALGKPVWIARARKALSVFAAEIADGSPLVRVRKDGVRKGVAFLDDHADLACAALDVHEASLAGSVSGAPPVSVSGGRSPATGGASGDLGALELARELVERAIRGFWDETEGAFELAPKSQSDLVARPKDAYDNATPSGPASMAHALLRLSSYVEEPRYERIADVLIRSLGPLALEHPAGFSHLACALDLAARGPVEIVVVAEPGDPDGDALVRAAQQAWCPNRVLSRATPGSRDGLARRLGSAPSGPARAAAYVCRDRTCELPVSTAADLTAKLEPGGRS